MTIESQLASLTVSVNALDDTVREELVDIDNDLTNIRGRLTSVEMTLGIPEDRDSPDNGSVLKPPPGNPDGSAGAYVKYDPATKQLCTWDGNSYHCVLFEPIATPEGLDIDQIIQDITTSIDQNLATRADTIATQVEAQVQATVDQLINDLANNSSVVSRLDTVEDDLAAASTLLGSRIDDNVAAIESEETARVAADSALTTSVNTLAATVDDNHSAFLTFQATASAAGDSVQAATLATMLANIDNNTSRIVSAESAIATNQASAASRLNSLEASTAISTAQITSLQSAVASIDAVSSDQIDQLTAELEDQAAALQTESATRATADAALSTQVTALVATSNANTAAISQEATARASGDVANATAISNLATTVGNQQSAIQTVQTAQANLQTSVASSVTTLTSKVNTAEATVQTAASTVNGVTSKYGIKTSAGGVVTGIEMLSGANGTSQIKFKANSFVLSQDDEGGNLRTPFVVEGINTYMDTAFIKKASIDTLYIAGNAVTQAQSAQSGPQIEVTSTAFQTVLSMSVTVTGTQPILVWGTWTAAGAHIGSPSNYDNYFDGNYWKFNSSDTDSAVRFQLTGPKGTFQSPEALGITVPYAKGGTQMTQALFTNVPAGTYTLSFQARKTMGEHFGMRSMAMTMLETKR